MGVTKTVIIFVLLILVYRFNVLSLIFEYREAFVITLFVGCLLLKLFYKSIHKPYLGNEDMNGKTVLITGATVGAAKATAFDMAKRNARVLLACRNVPKGERVAAHIKSATGNQNIVIESLDLCSFASVRQCAKSILEREEKLHVLINGACILEDPRKETEDGCERIMQTNHFGPFLLTLLLLDLLKRSSPSRIINITSVVQAYANFDVEDLNNSRGLDQVSVYYNTKLANTLFTKELSKRLLRAGVTVNCVYPGFMPTELIKSTILAKIMLFIMGKTYEEAAQTIIALAVDPRLATTTGKYFHNCLETFSLSKKTEDVQLAQRLFELSERTVGLSLKNNLLNSFFEGTVSLMLSRTFELAAEQNDL